MWKKLLTHRSSIAGLLIISLMVGLAALGALKFSSQEEFRTNLSAPDKLLAPSAAHILGTDHLGRDIFEGICLGALLTLSIAIKTLLFAMILGIPFGAVSAYIGGWFDSLTMRFVDIMLAFPTIVLALTIMAAWGRSADNLVIAIGIPMVPIFIRQVRAAVLVNKHRDYVSASLALGAGHGRILFREIMPNSMAPIIVVATLSVGSAILSIAGLSFLGLGVPAGYAEWGIMLNDARMNIGVDYKKWWVIVFPGTAIALTVLGFNIFGDGLRDTLDPKMKKTR